ncbi:MAG: S8 family serine peptidase [Candidatus Poseidoniaceae archaeon]|jgi:serine protease AprX|nr:S8 family serine peptidase [Candidatus Poseidoniaceae archaeon]
MTKSSGTDVESELTIPTHGRFDSEVKDDFKSNPDDDFDFIQKITVGAMCLLLAVMGWYGYQLWTGEVTLVGPHPELLTEENSFANLIQLDEGNAAQLSGSGVKVCIVDSGVDATHPDLNNANIIDWVDMVNGKSEPYDDQNHGTMMAGILVADGGLSGVAPDVDLYIAKALAENGTGESSIVADAIDWCINKQVNIISLSLGGNQGTAGIILGDDVEDAVEDAYSAGIIVVAAAGNDGANDDGDVASPGNVRSVICVGAVDSRGSLWSGSSIGDNNGNLFPPKLPRNDPNKKPEVVAPGERVPVILPGGSWGYADGTSASTVYVTGAIALMLENNPSLKDGGEDMIDDLKQWIMDSSQMKSDQTNHDNHYGYGLLKINDLIVQSQS